MLQWERSTSVQPNEGNHLAKANMGLHGPKYIFLQTPKALQRPKFSPLLKPLGLLGPNFPTALNHSPCRGSRTSRSAASCRRRPPPRPLAGLRRWLRRPYPAEGSLSCAAAVAPRYAPDPSLDFWVLALVPSASSSKLPWLVWFGL